MRRPTRKKAARKAIRKVAATVAPKAASFLFLGFQNGWYALRATSIDLNFQNEVVEWLIDEGITIGKWSWAGNGTVYPDRPKLPVAKDGSQFGVIFKRPADVIRFEMRFPCLGITPQNMLEALRLEATQTRLTVEGIARIAYDANMRLIIVTGTAYPTWDEVSSEDRDMFITGVRMQIDHPDRTAEQIHQYWVDDRIRNGWTYGAVRDPDRKTHPSMVPFEELSLVEKVKDTLLANIVTSLLPLLDA